jgi:hypothetical protein
MIREEIIDSITPSWTNTYVDEKEYNISDTTTLLKCINYPQIVNK